MDLDSIKVQGWTVESAQMKHTARKYSMATVAQSWMRKHAATAGIADYQKTLEAVRDTPEAYETLSEPEREFCDLASTVGVWSAICGCVKPYISIDEWLGLDDGTVNDLSAACDKLNPHWLTSPEQEKKTAKRHRKSTKK